ncbi:MAG: serine hydroxymethyltransferase, partial [Acidobacteria bacterium]|nr:serine hydroxymethyltransferase [Acidobacteriota bacterium]
NTVPFDTRKPYIASGLRIGTPAITSRGMGVAEMEIIATLIDRVLRADEDKEDRVKLDAFHAEMEAVKAEVYQLTEKFPLY